MATNEPTNKEILKEIRDMNTRIIALETWKVSEDAFKAAMVLVRQEEKEAKYDSKRNEIFKQTSIILGLIATILAAYAATKGIGI